MTIPVKWVVCRYGQYTDLQRQKDELMKVINEKLIEYETSNRAHEVPFAVNLSSLLAVPGFGTCWFMTCCIRLPYLLVTSCIWIGLT